MEANGSGFLFDPSFTIPLTWNCAWVPSEKKKNDNKKYFIDRFYTAVFCSRLKIKIRLVWATRRIFFGIFRFILS
jgi:hypothetical protein